MGGVDVVLGVKWLQYLGTIDFNFKEIFLKFFFRRKGSRITGYRKEAEKDNNLYCHEKASEEITMRHNCTIMHTRSSNIKIIPRCLKLPKDSHLFVILIMLFILFQEVFLQTSRLTYILMSERDKLNV